MNRDRLTILKDNYFFLGELIKESKDFASYHQLRVLQVRRRRIGYVIKKIEKGLHKST